jgi:uncharacterized delta-60 repeat protein
MNYPIRLTVCALLLSVSRLSAATHYVSLGSKSPVPPYATWATAALNIQQAVDASQAGDTVLVTNGLYNVGQRDVGSGPSRVAMTKAIALLSVQGPQFTVIDGGGTNRCAYLANGASLSGFTLRNGWASVTNGGGVWCASTNAFLTNCTLTGNSAPWFGGGAYGGTLYNCTLSGNGAVGGGEFYEGGSGGGAYGGTLNNCTLTGNVASFGGGAFGCTLNNCTLSSNLAIDIHSPPSGGGATSCTLNNCTLTGNSASASRFPYPFGGGASGSTLYNCIVYSNMAYSADFGPLAIDDAHLSTLRYCCTTYGPTSGVGNITGDPLFVDYAGGNLRLQPTSPCIDAGDIAYAPGPVDLDGNPRIVDDMVDMGAYEFQGPRNWPPVFGAQPASQIQDAGTSASFYVTVSGPGPFAFQWRKDGVPLLDGADIAGAATATLTLRDVLEAAAGGYSVVVSNQYGSVTSAVALLNVNLATLDSGFKPGANNAVYALALQGEGEILVGGWFTTLGGQTRSSIGRLNADGTLDGKFNPGAGGFEPSVSSLAVQADGKILVGGYFPTLGGQSRNNIGRLNADGTPDSGFNPGADSQVRSLALQADGKILVGGSFATLGGQARNCIGRLNADGTLDPAFNPGAGGVSPAAFSLALQADGKILVGGDFGGNGWGNIVRLNADGTLDSGFNPGASYYVYSLAVQADGKILVGGGFTTLGGQPCTCLGRLNADGTLDSAFDPGADSEVYSLAVQADGKILVGGGFTTLGGQTRNYIGRLNADGTLDSAFKPAANSPVESLAVQADGKILVGGLFTTLGGQPRNYIGRLNNTVPATPSLTYDGSTITWLRGGTSPEVWRTTFDFSTNAVNWVSLGAATRIGGGWQLTNTSLPSTTGTIRARGWVAGGGQNCWFVETHFVVGPPPVILVNDPSFGFSSNRFGFKFSGTAGQVVVVETSTNLASWTPLATNTLGTTPVYFSEPYSGNFPQRFYRLRTTAP